MIAVQFVPLDTWFFRDGTPFTAQSAPQEDVGSLFPPYPPTLVGALRAALARANGWDGAGRWPPELCEVLGDGPEDLGVLSFAGPFLLRDGQPLFQAPRHLLGASRECGWRPAGFLRPGSPVACDLGHVPLPEFPDAVGDAGTLKTADDVWLTALGMNAVLRGQLPGTDDVVSSRSLWTPEHRIGLKRDKAVRAAKEGMLYSSRHVRPGRAISLGVRVSGLPEESTPRALSELAPLGGESRVAELTPWRRRPASRPTAGPDYEDAAGFAHRGVAARSRNGDLPWAAVGTGPRRGPRRFRLPGTPAARRRLGLAGASTAGGSVRASARQRSVLRNSGFGRVRIGCCLRQWDGTSRITAGVGLRSRGPRGLA